MDTIKWQFPKEQLKDLDPQDYDDAVFHLSAKTFKDEMYMQYQAELGLPTFEAWAANKYGTHIKKIVTEDCTLENADDIMDFVYNLEPTRGYMLQLAILQRKGFLEKGQVKN